MIWLGDFLWRAHITNFFKTERILMIQDLYKINLLKVCLKRLRYKDFQSNFLKIRLSEQITRSSNYRVFVMQQTHRQNQVIYQLQKFFNETGKYYNKEYRIKTDVKHYSDNIINNYTITNCNKRNCFPCRQDNNTPIL